MKILELVQGSDEWKATRRQYDTASEASVMMGCSPHVSRNELVKMCAIGSEQEIDYFLQKIFDKGHAVEALARPIAEEIIGEELYPITALCEDGQLLASFDGATVVGIIIWECKQWNQFKAEDVQESALPDCDKCRITETWRNRV